MKTCPYCGKRYPDDAMVCTTDQTPLVERLPENTLPTGPHLSAKSTTTCPKCGAFDGYEPAIGLRDSFNFFALATGGILGLIFLNAGRAKRVRCNKCKAIFSVRPPFSKVARVIFWVLVGPTTLVLIAYFVSVLVSVFSK